MKIAIDIRPLVENQLTGVGVYQKYLLKYLPSLVPDWQITYFISGRNLIEANVRQLIYLRPQDKLLYINQSNRLLNIKYLLGIRPKFVDELDKLDIFFMPNLNFMPLRLKAKLVLTVHDLSFLHDSSFFDNKTRLWHKLIQLKKILTKANKIITVSDSTRRELLKYFRQLTENNAQVIYPGVEMNNLTQEEEQRIISKLALPEKFILFLGTLEPRKNLASLIKAFEFFKQQQTGYKLVVAGKEGWLSRSLVKQITSNSDIIWLKYVSDDEKIALYKTATMLVWPSYYEGFGFPPLEALCQGTPIIVSHKTSLPEVFGSSAHYVNPNNYVELAEVMKQIIAFDKTKTLANSDFASKFSWSKTAELTVNFIKQ